MTGDSTAVADLHNHLVPAVDDGARSVADVLDAVERMARAGIRRIITTPHLDASLLAEPRLMEPRMEEILQAWQKGSAAVKEAFPEVDFRRGFEIMLDVPDPDFQDPRVRLAGTSFVLVEWPRMQIPPGTVEVIARIRQAGWRPILAHPERYYGMGDDLELASEWRRVGAYLQVNYGSLVGRYGPEPRNLAHRLLREGWVDYLSTDFHGRPELELFREEVVARFRDLEAEEQLTILTTTNTSRVFRDEEPLPVPPLSGNRGFWGRVRDLLHIDGVP